MIQQAHTVHSILVAAELPEIHIGRMMMLSGKRGSREDVITG